MTSRGIGLKPCPGEGLGDPASAGQHRGPLEVLCPGLLASQPHPLPLHPGAAAPQVIPVRWPLGDSPTVLRGPAQGAVLTQARPRCCGGRRAGGAPLGSWPALLGGRSSPGQRNQGAARPGGSRPCRSAGCGAPLLAHTLGESSPQLRGPVGAHRSPHQDTLSDCGWPSASSAGVQWTAGPLSMAGSCGHTL